MNVGDVYKRKNWIDDYLVVISNILPKRYGSNSLTKLIYK